MNRNEQVDIATILLRILQLNREKKPDHWIWERIKEFDVPRLMAYITDVEIRTSFDRLRAEFADDSLEDERTVLLRGTVIDEVDH